MSLCSGLDPVNTELLKQVIFQEKERGATIIFSDHVMTNVEELCDDILMIRDGRVVLHGPVQDVRNQVTGKRVFLFQVNEARKNWKIFLMSNR